MSPLAEALVGAAKVGFDAPKCARCEGKGSRFGRYRFPSYRQDDPLVWENQACHECHATGLDASDPEKLIGRAESWLLARDHYPGLQSYPLSVHFELHNDAGAMIELVESHDKTAVSRAAAVLRLVARVGSNGP